MCTYLDLNLASILRVFSHFLKKVELKLHPDELTVFIRRCAIPKIYSN
jgi:hypothetical protein